MYLSRGFTKKFATFFEVECLFHSESEFLFIRLCTDFLLCSFR